MSDQVHSMVSEQLGIDGDDVVVTVMAKSSSTGWSIETPPGVVCAHRLEHAVMLARHLLANPLCSHPCDQCKLRNCLCGGEQGRYKQCPCRMWGEESEECIRSRAS